jgi:membrane-bound lytic murein transglycosylase D
MQLVLATNNPDKIREMKNLLDDLPITILSRDDFLEFPDVEETGTTLEENAIIKAKAIAEFCDLPSLADDSGLEVDALNGAPGVYSSRYAGEDVTYRDNNEKLIRELSDVPEEKRTARFRCVIAIAWSPDDIETIVRQYKGRSFGFASRNFYVAFLAALDVVRSANVYFDSIEWDLPDDTVTVTLPYYMSVQTLVDAFGVSQHTLKKNNPALLDSIWTGLKFVPKGYDLRLPPAELAAPVDQLLASIPNEQRFRHQTPDLEHRIRRGDSLSLIAVRYNTTVSELLAINNLKSRHRIRAGQVLHLPYKGAAQQAAISADTETYAVRSGDTLSQIAQRSGVSESELLALNGLSNGNRIYIGQELRLSAARVTNMASTSSSVRPAAVNQVEKWSAAGESPGQAQADVTVKPVLPEENVAARAAAPAEQGADTAMLADPSDYLVAADGTIEIQAEETLGHYASWLNIRTQKLRDLNGYDFRKPVVIGRQLKLDFTRVTPEQFLAKRIAYHRELQETFFARYRIADTKVHEFQRGDSLFVLSLRRYKVPVWLLRQYNPNLDLDRIKPGTQIVIPLIERVDSDTGLGGAVADA